MPRYTITLDLYIHAETDMEAIKLAEEITQDQRNKFDNQCRLLELHSTPFASMNVEKLDIEQIKYDNQSYNPEKF